MTTVAICTLDRPEALRRTLDSLAGQETSRAMSVLVVDNSSRGGAHEVWQRFAEKFSGNSDYVAITEPGLSRCRNAALERSATEFIAFLDDDVTLPATWFDALCDGIESPETVAAGGPIRLVWEGGRPEWLHREHETFFSGLDLGDAERDFSVPRETPFGANFVVRRRLALDVGAFDVRLGRAGRRLVGGEEVDLITRLARHGAVRYLPAAWVNHHIEVRRATRRWLLRRCFAQGKTGVLMHSGSAPDRARLEPSSGPARSRVVYRLPYSVARHLGAYAGTFGRSVDSMREPD